MMASSWPVARRLSRFRRVGTAGGKGSTELSAAIMFDMTLVTASPTADIAAGLSQARREHKRVILDFGGDWCGDCQVLDIYFHQPPNDHLLENNFVLVHVWVGHIDTHLDVAERYGVLIHKGVPELAVLSPDGRVLYAQKGEFEDMRNMESSSVTEFLEKWKG